MIFFFLMGCRADSVSQEKSIEEEVVVPQPEQEPSPSEPESAPTAEPDEELPSVIEDDLGEVDLDSSEDELIGRHMKRMTVVQIREAMIRVSGGVQWGGNSSDWDEYADILGVPDYQNVVDEDRSPSLMFQKFLDDAALYTCSEWLEAELEGSSQLFFTESYDDLDREKVMANIVHLRWQVQGKNRLSEDPVLEDYEDLFYTVHQRSDSFIESWQTVCVAMFTHPDFFYY